MILSIYIKKKKKKRKEAKSIKNGFTEYRDLPTQWTIDRWNAFTISAKRYLAINIASSLRFQIRFKIDRCNRADLTTISTKFENLSPKRNYVYKSFLRVFEYFPDLLCKQRNPVFVTLSVKLDDTIAPRS